MFVLIHDRRCDETGGMGEDEECIKEKTPRICSLGVFVLMSLRENIDFIHLAY